MIQEILNGLRKNFSCSFLVLRSSAGDTNWYRSVKGESEKQDVWFKKTLKAAKGAKSPVFIMQHISVYLKKLDETEDA